MIKQYRKKPVIIDAVQFFGESEDVGDIYDLFGQQKDVGVSYADPKNPTLKIEILEGTMIASKGDFIIKGVQGEFYHCKPDIFEACYEEVK
jgi:hypothetical protein